MQIEFNLIKDSAIQAKPGVPLALAETDRDRESGLMTGPGTTRRVAGANLALFPARKPVQTVTLRLTPGHGAIMNYRKLETGLAWFSLVGAIIHFVLETLYHFKFGQFLPLLVVDYIAAALLIYAAVLSLGVRPSSASGMLAGAWGFAACLAYVAFFAFYRQYLQDQGPMFMVLVMGVALLAAFVAFLVSLLLVRAAMNQA